MAIWVGIGIPHWKISYKVSQFASDLEGDKRFTKTAYMFKHNSKWPYVLIHDRGMKSFLSQYRTVEV